MTLAKQPTSPKVRVVDAYCSKCGGKIVRCGPLWIPFEADAMFVKWAASRITHRQTFNPCGGQVIVAVEAVAHAL